MVNVNDLSPSSNTLKASDFEGGEWEVTISGYEIREFDQTDQKTGEHYKQKKPVFSFHETEKTMVCNKTNRNSIAYVYGDEMDNWINKKIFLYAELVEFGGKQVEGIRVRVPKPVKKPTTPKRAVAPTPEELDDEVPF